MPVRGVRGAVVAAEDHPEAILTATRELLLAVMQANPSMETEEVASAVFTVTQDLTAAYPARAARELGWGHVPMMCAQEIPVPGGLPRCIRILIHWNTERSQREVQHVYLGATTQLRPDLCAE